MTTTKIDIAKAKPTRLGSYLRNASVPASLREQDWTDLAEFLINLDFEVWDFVDLEDLDRVLGDIEFAGRAELNEGAFRAHKSTSQKRAYARRWYQKNKGHLAARRRKLKNSISAKAQQKKKERLRKQRKTLNKKPISKYPSAKNHSNESRITFAELVKPLSEKYSVKSDMEKEDVPVYFLAEQALKIGEVQIKAGHKFILKGHTIIFEKDNKRYKINDPIPILPYLRKI